MDGILFTIVCIILIAILYKFPSFYQNYKHAQKINKIPGPPRYPIIGSMLPFLLVPRHKRFEVFAGLVEKYKSLGLFRMWIGSIPEIRITKCDHAEKIFKSSKHIEKSKTYELIESWLGKGEYLCGMQREMEKFM